jgi:hypothetical protein
MVTLEDFKKYIGHITAQMAKDDVLSDLLVCEDTSGWVSTAAELIDDVIELISEQIKGECTAYWISWWLWEVDRDEKDGNKNNHVWIKNEDEQTYKYSIEDLDDLYYLITEQYEQIKVKVPEEAPENDFEPSVEHPNFTGETLYDVFMRSMDSYKESNN